MAMKPAAAPKQLYLDVLRGIAILMVFGVHLHGATFGGDLPWVGYFHDYTGIAFSRRVTLFMGLGHLGVALFFVLSGYCIHLSFLSYEAKNKGAFSLPRFLKYFFIRRFFRIYPAYLVAILFFLFVYHWGRYEGAMWWKQVISHLLLVHNCDMDTYSGINGAFWSLSYEWQLYCLFPFFLWLRARVGLDRAFALVAVGSFFYTSFSRNVGPDLFVLADAVFRSRYAFVWFLGVYLCEKHQRGERVFPDSRAGLIAAYALGLAATQFKPFSPLLWEIFGPVFAWTLEFYRERPRFSALERGLAGVGVISYSLYLYHGPLIEFLLKMEKPLLAFGYPWSQLTLGGFVFVFGPLAALAWVSYRFVEMPFHNLGLRLTRAPLSVAGK